MSKTSKEQLAIYLNDHLGGSVGALALLEDLIACTKDGSQQTALAELLREIQGDQQVLRDMMKTAQIKESATKKGLAWLTEKLTSPKLLKRVRGGGGLGSLQALEALYLGITGKLLLWRVLESTVGHSVFPGVDFEHLSIRADTQRRQVDKMRCAAASQVLG